MLRRLAGLSTDIFRRNMSSSIPEAATSYSAKAEFKTEAGHNNAPYRGYSKNRVELVGGVVSDPVERTSKNGGKYTIINLATGNGDFVDYHNIMVFGRLVDNVLSTTKKGNRIFVTGFLKYFGGKLDSDGKRTPRHTQIHANTVTHFVKTSVPNQDSTPAAH